MSVPHNGVRRVFWWRRHFVEYKVNRLHVYCQSHWSVFHHSVLCYKIMVLVSSCALPHHLPNIKTNASLLILQIPMNIVCHKILSVFRPRSALLLVRLQFLIYAHRQVQTPLNNS